MAAADRIPRSRTFNIEKSEVDFMVDEFSCHDCGGLRQALGGHRKVSTWKVLVSGRAEPIEIVLTVEKSVLGLAEASLVADRQRLLPKRPEVEREALTDDFLHSWNFRGAAKGLNEPHRHEARPPLGLGRAAAEWHPATLTRQREDGDFEATVLMPDGRGGFQDVAFPAIRGEDIREAETQRPLLIPHRTLDLKVPRHDPLKAVLSVDGHELITHFFVRQTPPQSVQLQVDRSRSTVSAAVGHSLFSHFLSREVRRVSHRADRFRAAWRLQIGPFAEHTVEVARRGRWAKAVVLSVDARALVDSSAEDIDCDEGGFWHVDFRFAGEHSLDFEVYETNQHGTPLETKGVARRLHRFACDCAVTIEDEADLTTAILVVDGVDFAELRPKVERPHPEPPLAVSVQAMQQQYGVAVPVRVKEQGTCAALADLRLGELLRCCSPQRHVQAALVDAAQFVVTPKAAAARGGA